jgi:tRNA(Arg) A34 adenosine deaminase TadA
MREATCSCGERIPISPSNDITGRAQLNVVREAARRFGPEVLAAATLYMSTEPCAMCSGAIYWSGVRRVVFGARAARLHELFNRSSEGSALLVPCRDVLESGTQPVEVIGPILEDEAIEVHVESAG